MEAFMKYQVVEQPDLDKVLGAEDDSNMASGWHYQASHLLVSSLMWHLRNLDDFYVGAYNFLYYSADQARSRNSRGPDFYYVKGVSRQPLRQYWCAWQENGRLPNLIIKLSSPATTAEDHGVKKDTYQQLHVDEYYCYDPTTRLLEGWRLNAKHRYGAIPADHRGWLWSEELQLWLGSWTGEFEHHQETWLRFFEADGTLVPTTVEAQAEEVARLRAMLEVHKPG
jgi:Uma2 family endonuclease